MVAVLDDKLVLEEIGVPGFHKVVKISHPQAKLQAIIALHDLRLGKAALGGTRIYPYATFKDALFDVTRLARGMTHKAAALQCGWGGGKSVIIADPAKDKTEDLLASFGEAVNRLKGEYICAEDYGCTPDDMAIVAKYTPYVVGLPHKKSSGNPSPFTAWGVFRGIQAVMHHVFGSDSVAGKTIAIQGAGSVGKKLAELLFWHGAKLFITDIDRKKAQELAAQVGGQFVEPDAIFDVPCDIFAPCALGGILNSQTIPRLRCRAVAGAANNQLLTEQDGTALSRLGILYAPDFVINAGGLINVTEETMPNGYSAFSARAKVDHIYDELKLIFNVATQNYITTQEAVMRLVEYRLTQGIGKRTQPIYLHHANLSY